MVRDTTKSLTTIGSLVRRTWNKEDFYVENGIKRVFMEAGVKEQRKEDENKIRIWTRKTIV